MKAFISGLGGKNLFNSLDFCFKKKKKKIWLIWLEIWKNCHLKTQKKPSFPVWGAKTSLILWIFASKKKKNFAYFAWKLKILSLKNAIKASYFRFWGEKSCKFQIFCARSSKNMFQKSTSASVFLAILPFLDPIFTNFLPQSAWSLQKFEKSADLGEIELLPVENSKEVGLFLEIFLKNWPKKVIFKNRKGK